MENTRSFNVCDKYCYYYSSRGLEFLILVWLFIFCPTKLELFSIVAISMFYSLPGTEEMVLSKIAKQQNCMLKAFCF